MAGLGNETFLIHWSKYRLEGRDVERRPAWTRRKDQVSLLLKSPLSASAILQREKEQAERTQARPGEAAGSGSPTTRKRKASGGPLIGETVSKKRNARQSSHFPTTLVPYDEFISCARPRSIARILPDLKEFNHLFPPLAVSSSGPVASEEGSSSGAASSTVPPSEARSSRMFTQAERVRVQAWHASRVGCLFLSLVEARGRASSTDSSQSLSSPPRQSLTPVPDPTKVDSTSSPTSSDAIAPAIDVSQTTSISPPLDAGPDPTNVNPVSPPPVSSIDSPSSPCMAGSPPPESPESLAPPSTDLSSRFEVPFMLTLASTVSHCTDECDQKQPRLFFGAELLAHVCEKRGYRPHKLQSRVDEVASAAAANILKLIDADPKTTTTADIDSVEFKSRFVCDEDNCDYHSDDRYRTVFDFRAAVYHAVRIHKKPDARFVVANEHLAQSARDRALLTSNHHHHLGLGTPSGCVGGLGRREPGLPGSSKSAALRRKPATYAERRWYPQNRGRRRGRRPTPPTHPGFPR